MKNDSLAIILKIGSAACVVALGASVHAAAKSGAPIGQIMAMRAGVSLLLITFYGLSTGPISRMLPINLRLHILRGGLACIAMYLVYVAYANLPITVAQSIGYLAPILTLPFAALALRERIVPSTIAAVGLGFGGVLLILGVVSDLGRTALIGALAALTAAALIAGIQVLIRSMMRTEAPVAVAFSFSIIVTLLTMPTALWGNWVSLTPTLFTWLLLAGVFGAGTLILNTEAVSRSEVGRLAPFEYTGLLFALSLDWILFGYLPRWLGLLGGILIIAGALVGLIKPPPRQADPR